MIEFGQIAPAFSILTLPDVGRREAGVSHAIVKISQHFFKI